MRTLGCGRLVVFTTTDPPPQCEHCLGSPTVRHSLVEGNYLAQQGKIYLVEEM